jgi:hypothetical protein
MKSSIMKSYNVGGWDRRIRYALGFLFPVMGAFSKKRGIIRTMFWIIGLNGLITAYFKYSPLNKFLGYSSYPTKRGFFRALRLAR